MTHTRRWRIGLAWLQLALGLALFGVSLLAVFEAPIRLLWKPAVVATEWGHLLALVACAAAALPGWRARPGRVGALFALVAALAFASPLARARSVAAELPQRLTRAFGDAPAHELAGAPRRPGALVLGDLLWVAAGEVEVTRHIYREVDGEALPLELHLRADAPRPCPVVVSIHGGSWSSGSLRQLPATNTYLAARGYAVCALAYRLAPRHPFPAAHEDVLGVLAWLARAGPALGLDPQRVVLLGRSAGGHLALLAGYRAADASIRGIVAYYAPTDMLWSYAHPSNPLVFDSIGVLESFLGGAPAERAEAYRDASPLLFATAQSPPTLLVHGGRDELVFARQSELLDERLTELGVPHLYLELPWATHGCDANPAGPSGQLSLYAIEHFLASVLRR